MAAILDVFERRCECICVMQHFAGTLDEHATAGHPAAWLPLCKLHVLQPQLPVLRAIRRNPSLKCRPRHTGVSAGFTRSDRRCFCPRSCEEQLPSGWRTPRQPPPQRASIHDAVDSVYDLHSRSRHRPHAALCST